MKDLKRLLSTGLVSLLVFSGSWRIRGERVSSAPPLFDVSCVRGEGSEPFMLHFVFKGSSPVEGYSKTGI